MRLPSAAREANKRAEEGWMPLHSNHSLRQENEAAVHADLSFQLSGRLPLENQTFHSVCLNYTWTQLICISKYSELWSA